MLNPTFLPRACGTKPNKSPPPPPPLQLLHQQWLHFCKKKQWGPENKAHWLPRYSPHVCVISGFHGYAVCHGEYNLQHLFSGTFGHSAHVHTSSAHLAWNTKPRSAHDTATAAARTLGPWGYDLCARSGTNTAMVVSKRRSGSWTDIASSREEATANGIKCKMHDQLPG